MFNSKKPLLIAEIGWNHMGNMRLAKKMILEAKKNGADFAKFQTWSVDNLKEGSWDKDGRRKIYEKAQLTHKKHVLLKNYCRKIKIKFLTSVFNEKDLDWLSKLSNTVIKIPSHEIYNIKLIEQSLKKFKYVVISTGVAKWKEILKIHKLIKNKKKQNYVCVLHCVSTYPCNYENANLPRINSLKKLFKYVGYSGHCSGIYDGIASVQYGAKVIEKHFTLDNRLPGRDNKFAILPKELKDLSSYININQFMKKNKGKNLQKFEFDTFKNYRGRWKKN